MFGYLYQAITTATSWLAASNTSTKPNTPKPASHPTTLISTDEVTTSLRQGHRHNPRNRSSPTNFSSSSSRTSGGTRNQHRIQKNHKTRLSPTLKPNKTNVATCTTQSQSRSQPDIPFQIQRFRTLPTQNPAQQISLQNYNAGLIFNLNRQLRSQRIHHNDDDNNDEPTTSTSATSIVSRTNVRIVMRQDGVRDYIFGGSDHDGDGDVFMNKATNETVDGNGSEDEDEADDSRRQMHLGALLISIKDPLYIAQMGWGMTRTEAAEWCAWMSAVDLEWQVQTSVDGECKSRQGRARVVECARQDRVKGILKKGSVWVDGADESGIPMQTRKTVRWEKTPGLILLDDNDELSQGTETTGSGSRTVVGDLID